VEVRLRIDMSQARESQKPGERRASVKLVAGVLAVYGALIVVTVRVATGNQLSPHPAIQAQAVASLPAKNAALSRPFVPNSFVADW
jgi:hypothetical protein